MNQYTQGRPQSQVRRIAQCRQQMMKDQDLCFRRLLPQEKGCDGVSFGSGCTNSW